MDSQTRGYLDRKFETVVDRLDVIRVGDDPKLHGVETHPANLETILDLIKDLTADVDAIKRRLDTTP
jgi:hypothetical protein